MGLHGWISCFVLVVGTVAVPDQQCSKGECDIIEETSLLQSWQQVQARAGNAKIIDSGSTRLDVEKAGSSTSSDSANNDKGAKEPEQITLQKTDASVSGTSAKEVTEYSQPQIMDEETSTRTKVKISQADAENRTWGGGGGGTCVGDYKMKIGAKSWWRKGHEGMRLGCIGPLHLANTFNFGLGYDTFVCNSRPDSDGVTVKADRCSTTKMDHQGAVKLGADAKVATDPADAGASGSVSAASEEASHMQLEYAQVQVYDVTRLIQEINVKMKGRFKTWAHVLSSNSDKRMALVDGIVIATTQSYITTTGASSGHAAGSASPAVTGSVSGEGSLSFETSASTSFQYPPGAVLGYSLQILEFNADKTEILASSRREPCAWSSCSCT